MGYTREGTETCNQDGAVVSCHEGFDHSVSLLGDGVYHQLHDRGNCDGRRTAACVNFGFGLFDGGFNFSGSHSVTAYVDNVIRSPCDSDVTIFIITCAITCKIDSFAIFFYIAKV